MAVLVSHSLLLLERQERALLATDVSVRHAGDLHAELFRLRDALADAAAHGARLERDEGAWPIAVLRNEIAGSLALLREPPASSESAGKVATQLADLAPGLDAAADGRGGPELPARPRGSRRTHRDQYPPGGDRRCPTGSARVGRGAAPAAPRHHRPRRLRRTAGRAPGGARHRRALADQAGCGIGP